MVLQTFIKTLYRIFKAFFKLTYFPDKHSTETWNVILNVFTKDIKNWGAVDSDTHKLVL